MFNIAHIYGDFRFIQVNLLGGESQGYDHEFKRQQLPLTGLGA